MGTKNAVIKIKDQSGTVYEVNPKTGISNVEGLQTALNGKVSTVSGKGLSTNDYTTTEKNKLAGIAAGATANIGTVTQVKVGSTAYNPSSGVVSLPAYPTTLPASDVSSWAKASAKPTYTASEVGAIATTAKGTSNGVAELDANGKVPSSQLPAYVDDVLEYTAKSSFPTTGETGKIYVDTTTNLTYRWSGSAYVEISPSLALGETSSTAYRGDRGKTAYTHSQLTSGNPHNVSKSDVGLGNVGNFKAVSTVASQGLSDTEKSNARSNIGAGTSSFSGSYSDLSNKPTIPTKVSQLTNDSGYTTNTGTVTGVKVGSTSYSPSSGVVSLPAYPTTLPASDVSSWAKASSKPTYTASEVGLGNVGNFKAVSTVASQGLSSTEKSNARANIGAGTSSFSGSYSDLSNKPTIPTKTSQLTNDSGYTTNTGTVTGVKVGSTSYSPSSGVVSLPAYPTTLPASDVSSWAKATSKPSYTASEVGAAASSHTHGNIQNGGTLQTNDITIASGDKLVVTDSSDSSKIARTSISFDGSTTSQALTKAGSWQTFNNYSHPTSAGNKHIPSGGSSGQILGYGGSSGTAAWRNLPTVDSEFSASSTNAVQNKVVTSELAALIDDGAKNYAYIPDYTNQSGAGYYSDIYFNIPAGDWVLSYTLTTSANFAAAVTIDGSEELYYDNSAPYSNARISHTLKTASSGITRFRVYFNATGTISNIMICKLADWKISQKYVPYRTTLNTFTYRMRSYTISSGAPVKMPLVRSETFTMLLFGFVQTIGCVFWALENMSGNTITVRDVYSGQTVSQSALNFSLNVGDHMLTITTNISSNSNFMIMASTA